MSARAAFGLAVALTMAMAPGCGLRPAADPRPPPVEFGTESRFVKLGPDPELVVSNPWGDVRLRQHRPGAVEVVAAVQRIGVRPPPAPSITADIDGAVASVAVSFAGARRERPRTGRVDLVVYLPPVMPARVETVDGLIEAKKTANPLTLRSVSGDIVAVNDGSIDAVTGSGRVQARPMTPGFGRMQLESRSGPVFAFVPVPSSFRLCVRGTEDVAGEWAMARTDGACVSTAAGGAGAPDRIDLASSDMIRFYRSAVEAGTPAASIRKPR